MNKKLLWFCLGIYLVVSVGLANADPFIAYDFAPSGVQNWTGRLGNNFTVGGTPIDVLALGVYDNPLSGLASTLEVGIFDNTTGILQTSLTIGPGVTGTVVGNEQFVNLATPLTLPAGFVGSIVAVGFGHGDLNSNTNLGSPTPSLGTGGGLISFPTLTGWYDSNISLGTTLGSTPIFGSWYFGGGTFEYQAQASAVPEPTSLLLLGSGLSMIGLGAWRRRK